MVVSQVGEVRLSPPVVSVARVAAARGLTASEVRADAALRGRLVLEAGESRLEDLEWREVCAALTEAHRRAAAAHPRASGECRACGHPVRWVETVNGRRMTLDPLPCPELGNVEIKPSGSRLLAFVSSPAMVPLASRSVWRPHAATCPRRPGRPQPRSKRKAVPRCAVCRKEMDRKMYDLGERTHPCCSEVSGG